MKRFLLLSGFALASAQAHADELYVTHVEVPLFDVDLNYREDEDEMLSRIHHAAVFACGGRPDIRDRDARREFRRCVADAVTDALDQVDEAYDDD